MSSTRLHLAAALVAGVLALAGSGCRASQQAQLNVLSVEKAATPDRDMVVYVEVVNRAKRPMRLERLQYTFASASGDTRTTQAEILLGRRLVEAGSAVVVEVPLPVAATSEGRTLTLAGKLWAEQDEIVRSFAVAAEVATPVERLP